MSLIARQTREIEPVPQGTFAAVCFGVIEHWRHYNAKYNREEQTIVLAFEIPELRVEAKGMNLPRTIFKTYTIRLPGKSILRKDLEAWRGRALTKAECGGFDLKNLLGIACQLQVIHKSSSDGKVYANVDELMPLPKGVTAPRPQRKKLFLDLEPRENQRIRVGGWPDWVKEAIPF